jgi:hypothetical protein
MRRFLVLYGGDIRAYASKEIEAETGDDAIRIAGEPDQPKDLILEPAWESGVLNIKIVSIQEIIGKDGGGNDIYTEPIYEA